MHSFWAYVYLLRAPLLTWVFVLLFGPIASGNELLRSLLEGTIREQAWALLAAMLACRCAKGAAENIVRNGEERFGVKFRPPGMLFMGMLGAALGWPGGVWCLFGGCCALAYSLMARGRLLGLVAGIVTFAAFALLDNWWAAAVGAALFAGLAWLTRRFEQYLTGLDAAIWEPLNKEQVRVALDFGVFAFPAIVVAISMATHSQTSFGLDLVPLLIAIFVGPLFLWYALEDQMTAGLHAWVEQRLRGIRLSSWPWVRSAAKGFVEFDAEGYVRALRSGHWNLVVLGGLTGFCFWWLSQAKAGVLNGESAAELPWWSPGSAPAVAFLFLGLAILCLILSFFTFLLDRYRTPLLVLLAAFAWLGSTPGTDYVFPVRALPQFARTTPGEVLATRPRAIVVAAAGGGVQAAGWTARVLSGLSEDEKDFDRSVGAISSVSGGAVGSMYYLAAQAASDKEALSKAWRKAVEPSLDAFAWALITKDLPAALAGPLVRTREEDRATTFEALLAKRAGLRNVWISDWSRKTGAVLPAALFNAFEVETGRPVVVSTTAFPQRRDYIDLLARHDVPVVTAARLSSSFAYVSPVARPNTARQEPHIADGGYFDNYGLATLYEWLRDGLAGQKRPVLLIQIVAFPESEAKPLEPMGWGYQLYAPALGIARMRGMSQGIRGDAETDLMKRQWGVQTVEFRFDGGEECRKPPLSWDLNSREIACLDTAWRAATAQRKVVKDFLAAAAQKPAPADSR